MSDQIHRPLLAEESATDRAVKYATGWRPEEEEERQELLRR